MIRHVAEVSFYELLLANDESSKKAVGPRGVKRGLSSEDAIEDQLTVSSAETKPKDIST
ncbi:unnamed protein product [Malus baccata var. baccata]